MTQIIGQQILIIPSGGGSLIVTEFNDPGDEVWMVVNGVESPHRPVTAEQSTITLVESTALDGNIPVEAWTSTVPRPPSGGGGGGGGVTGIWVPYTPTWTAGSANPTLGNGTLVGEYAQVGKSVFVRIYLLTGSTTTLGTGAWEFSLPVGAQVGVVQSLTGALFDGDGSLSHRYSVAAVTDPNANPNDTLTRVFGASGGSTLDGTDPGSGTAWHAGTVLALNGVYQADVGSETGGPVVGPTGPTGPTGPQGPPGSGGGQDTYATQSQSSAATISFLTAQVHKLTLTGATVAVALTGATNLTPCDLTIYLVQDGTGNRHVTWPGSVKWPGGVAPTLSTAPGAVDLVVMESFDGGTSWYANVAGQAYG